MAFGQEEIFGGVVREVEYRKDEGLFVATCLGVGQSCGEE